MPSLPSLEVPNATVAERALSTLKFKSHLRREPILSRFPSQVLLYGPALQTLSLGVSGAPHIIRSIATIQGRADGRNVGAGESDARVACSSSLSSP
jgi:hypothetical protein